MINILASLSISETKGDASAQFNLGLMYYANGEDVQQDYKQAFYWFQKAAHQGNAKAQYNLGAFYINGYGVPKDIRQGVYWLQKAANQGDQDAQKILKQLGYK